MTLQQHFAEAFNRNLSLLASPGLPFPDETDRGFWNAVSAGSGCPMPPADRDWPDLPASLFREYRTTGNRTRYEAAYFERRRILADLVISILCRPDSENPDRLVDAIWSVCEESFWGLPAHNAVAGMESPDLCDPDEPILDLFAGETGAFLAWTIYLLRDSLDRVSLLVRRRVVRELKIRILHPFLDREDFWWMGTNLKPDQRVNNWNPWIVSNVLAITLLVDEFSNERSDVIFKACRLLDRFLAEYGPDGGCDEGAGYWTKAGASLFDALELLYIASEGRFDPFGEPLIGEIGRYITRMHIAGEYYVNFADGPARLHHVPGNLIHRYGRRINDEPMMDFGAVLTADQIQAWEIGDVPENMYRRLCRLTERENGDDAVRRNEIPAPLHHWFPDIQVMTARTRPKKDSGLFLACKGGHNNESHNHNDVGNFIIYADGRPLIVDAGVGVYTSRTFSDDRYGIWTMCSPWHNLPTVNGREQVPGRQYAASDVECLLSDDEGAFSLELAGAYPRDAGILSLRRRVILTRNAGESVTVEDTYNLEELPEDLRWSFIVAAEPGAFSSNTVALNFHEGPAVFLELETDAGLAFTMEQEELDISDDRLRESWPEGLRRLQFLAGESSVEGTVRFRIRPGSHS